jgi:hypothetical protein
LRQTIKQIVHLVKERFAKPFFNGLMPSRGRDRYFLDRYSIFPIQSRRNNAVDVIKINQLVALDDARQDQV